jgi:hypothetical protein
MSAALATAQDTASAESAGEAERATTAKPEALEPGAYGKAGSMREGLRKARPGVESKHCHERASVRCDRRCVARW